MFSTVVKNANGSATGVTASVSNLNKQLCVAGTSG